MSATVSEAEFRKYLHEYGASPSEVGSFLTARYWGSNDTLATYGIKLQMDLFVICRSKNTDYITMQQFKPETRR
ncbi:hypothetical protein PHMEG_00010259 [Phytophthora megakarya]|uniref:Uncharacterized protein n=1 Tax=Phytophthora megakarya TaxID=4795 RepID=A0A225WG59_9STRA|nr:hypothetical protein PHMEG_00010259 [Phytophthora megakarya]